MNSRSPLLAGLVLPLALTLVGCSGSDSDDEAGPGDTTSATGTATPTVDPTTDSGDPDDEPLLAAATTALAESKGTLVSIERARSGWSVTVVAEDGTESDLAVSLDGTKVIKAPVVDPDDDAADRKERLQQLAVVKISYAQALAAARPETVGVGFDELELDLDADRPAWEVVLGKGTKDSQTVTIDGTNGGVTGISFGD